METVNETGYCTRDQDLHELGQVYHSFIHNSPFVAWVKDAECRYRCVNQRFVELFHSDRESLIGQTDFAFMPVDVATALRENDQTVIEQARALRIVEDVPGADGVMRRWMVHKFPIEGADERRWSAGIAVDASEWLSVENQLERSEKNYRQLVEASPFCICQLNLAGQLTSVNAAGIRMFGGPQRDIIGDHLADFASAEDRLQVVSLLATAVGGESCELEFFSRLGTFCRTRLVTIPSTSAEAGSLLCIIEDVTEQRESEAQLRASEERHRLVAMAARDPIWEIDLVSDEIWWNEAYNRMFGTRPFDSRESWDWWTQRIADGDRDRVVTSLQNALADESTEHWSEDYSFVLDDGRVLLIQDRAFISRADDGTASRIVGTMRDQTQMLQDMKERAELSRKAEQSQRLESLGVLAGGVAHDFNNLLTIMLANIEVLKLQNPNSGEMLVQLEAAVDRAAEICQQMLAFSGKGRREVECIRLQPMIVDMVNLLTASIDKKISVKTQLDDHARPVDGDRAQISQVVMNLILNAAESMLGTQGLVTVRLTPAALTEPRHVMGDLLPAGRYVCLEVEDRGCGMSQDTLERIFDPFFTTKFMGRGMGLAAVQGIIKTHGGGLEANSEERVGTVFRVFLPESRHEPPTSTSHVVVAPTIQHDERGKVLVIDDESQVLHAVREMFERNGFETACAENGERGLKLFTASRLEFQLILLDVIMPRMDGAETLKRIRQIDADVPVILMSGYEQAQSAQKYALEPGASRFDGYLKKPFTSASLINLVCQTLAQSNV